MAEQLSLAPALLQQAGAVVEPERLDQTQEMALLDRGATGLRLQLLDRL
mgnify:CR=1 FL=1